MSLKTKLETKIPPPVYGLMTALTIWWLARLFPNMTLVPEPIRTFGLVLLFLGIAIDLTALGQFFKQKTTPNPLSPDKAKSIVISGLYHFSRNPMYLGMLISLTGWTLYQGNLTGTMCLPVFVLIINQMQILPEERALKVKFGDSYLSYLSQVRRWL